MSDYKITAAYFSPAGGTRRALEAVCGSLGGKTEYINMTMPQELVEERTFGEGELLVAAFPVYAGRVPAVDGLFRGFHGNGTPCVIVAAYGNRHYDDALAQCRRILREQGFLCVGAAACVTPHVFAPKLGEGRPDTRDRAALERFAEKVREKLKNYGKRAEPENGAFPEIDLPGDERPEAKPARPVEKRREDSLCVRCLRCARLCPVQAIDRGTLSVSEERCINCLNCVHVCEVRAITYQCGELAQFLTEHFCGPREVEVFV